MNDFLKRKIIEQSRHQFIYGYDGVERKIFFKNLEKDYPIKINETVPMAIYMNDFALPMIDFQSESFDKIKLESISRSFFDFSLIYNIVDRIAKLDCLSIINSRVDDFLRYISSVYLDGDFTLVTLNEFLFILEEARNFYFIYYENYLKGSALPNIDDLKMCYLEINSVLCSIKNMLNNQSYFAIIIDKQHDIPMLSTQAINSFVGKRCNKHLSMKIACALNKWDGYYDLDGLLVENVHDYDIVQLDNCVQQIKKFTL